MFVRYLVIAEEGVDAIYFLPSALNTKVKEFNQARVNGRSTYVCLLRQLMKYLVI